MKVYLPTSLNVEIEYWQQYREKHIIPAISESHSMDPFIFFTLDLFGKNYNMPLKVTGYKLDSFEAFTKPFIIKNILIATGKDFDEEKIAESMLEYDKILNKVSAGPSGIAWHMALHREEYKTSLLGKSVGRLISTPIRREDVGGDTLWLDFIKNFYEELVSGKRYEGMGRIQKWMFKQIFLGDIQDHRNNFAAVIYYEDADKFFAYTPGEQELDVEFFDLKLQKEMRELKQNKFIRFLKKLI